MGSMCNVFPVNSASNFTTDVFPHDVGPICGCTGFLLISKSLLVAFNMCKYFSMKCHNYQDSHPIHLNTFHQSF